MPGPLPAATRRRRNAPTVEGTVLPAEGRTARAPTVPKAYKLGPAGKAWWRYAWKLPQATKWDDGMIFIAARRAELEDLRAATGLNAEVDLEDLLAGAEPEAIKRVTWALDMLKRSASGTVTLMKEQDALDIQLGLTPKAMAQLRWSIAPSAPAAPSSVPQIADYRARSRG